VVKRHYPRRSTGGVVPQAGPRLSFPSGPPGVRRDSAQSVLICQGTAGPLHFTLPTPLGEVGLSVLQTQLFPEPLSSMGAGVRGSQAPLTGENPGTTIVCCPHTAIQRGKCSYFLSTPPWLSKESSGPEPKIR